MQQTPSPAIPVSRSPSLRSRYDDVRAHTEELCEPLETEDFVVSSMPDVSPTKWHIAHTSWFFETFVLNEHAIDYRSPDPRYAYLFNSYYVQAGERHCRAKRGLVTRPTVREVFDYRAHVDDAMRKLLDRIGDDSGHPAYTSIELGLNHEQQHQELLLTDIKHVLWMNPMRPIYRERISVVSELSSSLDWIDVAEGIYSIGHDGAGFSFDNERPAHRVFVQPFRIASRLVTKREFLEFINDDGYHRPELWLAAGYAAAQDGRWEAPLYWERASEDWTEFTLSGTRPIQLSEPVCHVSFYEADAFARWAGARLPTEAEWEIAAHNSTSLIQLFGATWQWTNSAYTAYPGFRAPKGAIGEYNGKWMADQWVLRGASCATPKTHARLTYRNFFPSATRWQFTGLRLAADGQPSR